MTHKPHHWKTGSATDIRGFAILAYTFFVLMMSGPVIIFAQLMRWAVRGDWRDWSTSLLFSVLKKDSKEIAWAGLGKFLIRIGELPLWLILPAFGAIGISLLFGAADWLDRRH